MMSTTSPTIAPGQRVIIRVDDGGDNAVEGRIDYLGERFAISQDVRVLDLIDAHTVLIEVTGHIIRSTGRASFLVAYDGHALRVHEQQIRPVESEVLV